MDNDHLHVLLYYCMISAPVVEILSRHGAVVKGVEHISTIEWREFESAGSVGGDLNLQKLNYQYLTSSVAVVLVVR